MAQNNEDNPLPDFDNIAIAVATDRLNTELPRLQNLQAIQVGQEIIDRLDNLGHQVTNIGHRLLESKIPQLG
ncbi:hypothetical protein MKZ38_007436 [Zalerion maritima]|uniref:Uncharacterized protein n=1 Tax=Zalerion maritima TaxID=339359 RepID=A0AAD5RUZ3_9PEZI|nr:hypothetical protein MKZ38_007436 [Zalerion maritima]